MKLKCVLDLGMRLGGDWEGCVEGALTGLQKRIPFWLRLLLSGRTLANYA